VTADTSYKSLATTHHPTVTHRSPHTTTAVSHAAIQCHSTSVVAVTARCCAKRDVCSVPFFGILRSYRPDVVSIRVVYSCILVALIVYTSATKTLNTKLDLYIATDINISPSNLPFTHYVSYNTSFQSSITSPLGSTFPLFTFSQLSPLNSQFTPHFSLWTIFFPSYRLFFLLTNLLTLNHTLHTLLYTTNN